VIFYTILHIKSKHIKYILEIWL